MSARLALFVLAEGCAGLWSLATSAVAPTLALVVALTALLFAVLYVIATEWAVPAAIARLNLRQQPVLPLVTGDGADQVYRELLSAAMGGECWHTRSATVPGCGCPADLEERARDARRQDMRFLRGPVRVAGAK